MSLHHFWVRCVLLRRPRTVAGVKMQVRRTHQVLGCIKKSSKLLQAARPAARAATCLDRSVQPTHSSIAIPKCTSSLVLPRRVDGSNPQTYAHSKVNEYPYQIRTKSVPSDAITWSHTYSNHAQKLVHGVDQRTKARMWVGYNIPLRQSWSISGNSRICP